MKILYDQKTGKIYARVKDSEWYYFPYKIEKGKYWILREDGLVNVHIGLDLLEISETAENKLNLIDLKNKENKEDESGDKKHSVEKGKIKEKPNWEEKVEEFPGH